MIYLAEMRFNLFDKIALGLRTNQFVNNFTILDEQDSRDAGDAIIHGQLRIMVHIHLTHVHFTVILFGELFNDRANGATRATPLCPEIHYG